MMYRIVTDPVDVAYVRENYLPCADPDPERQAPAYYDVDGTAYVPCDYLAQETDRMRFEQRALAEAKVLDWPFTAFDRVYFGRPVSRDVYIDDLRRQYPQIAAAAKPFSMLQ